MLPDDGVRDCASFDIGHDEVGELVVPLQHQSIHGSIMPLSTGRDEPSFMSRGRVNRAVCSPEESSVIRLLAVRGYTYPACVRARPTSTELAIVPGEITKLLEAWKEATPRLAKRSSR